MNISLYDASVAPLIRALENLAQILAKAADFALARGGGGGGGGMTAESLLGQRLHPDMFPLSRQVEIVVSGAKGSAARLACRIDANAEDPEFAVFNRGDEASFGDRLVTFEGLQALVQDGVAYLKTFSREEIDGAPASITVAKAGEQRIFETRSFVLTCVLPNAYFHIGMVYALLRSSGVDLGKKDFEGPPAYRRQELAQRG